MRGCTSYDTQEAIGRDGKNDVWGRSSPIQSARLYYDTQEAIGREGKGDIWERSSPIRSARLY